MIRADSKYSAAQYFCLQHHYMPLLSLQHSEKDYLYSIIFVTDTNQGCL
jgi:hypothetical protein